MPQDKPKSPKRTTQAEKILAFNWNLEVRCEVCSGCGATEKAIQGWTSGGAEISSLNVKDIQQLAWAADVDLYMMMALQEKV